MCDFCLSYSKTKFCYLCQKQTQILKAFIINDQYKFIHIDCAKWFCEIGIIVDPSNQSRSVFNLNFPLNKLVFINSCSICNKSEKNTFFIKCSNCDKYYHNKCIISNQNIKTISYSNKQYPSYSNSKIFCCSGGNHKALLSKEIKDDQINEIEIDQSIVKLSLNKLNNNETSNFFENLIEKIDYVNKDNQKLPEVPKYLNKKRQLIKKSKIPNSKLKFSFRKKITQVKCEYCLREIKSYEEICTKCNLMHHIKCNQVLCDSFSLDNQCYLCKCTNGIKVSFNCSDGNMNILIHPICFYFFHKYFNLDFTFNNKLISNRKLKICDICNKEGLTVKCKNYKCTLKVHPFCALKNKLNFIYKIKREDVNQKIKNIKVKLTKCYNYESKKLHSKFYSNQSIKVKKHRSCLKLIESVNVEILSNSYSQAKNICSNEIIKTNIWNRPDMIILMNNTDPNLIRIVENYEQDDKYVDTILNLIKDKNINVHDYRFGKISFDENNFIVLFKLNITSFEKSTNDLIYFSNEDNCNKHLKNNLNRLFSFCLTNKNTLSIEESLLSLFISPIMKSNIRNFSRLKESIIKINNVNLERLNAKSLLMTKYNNLVPFQILQKRLKIGLKFKSLKEILINKTEANLDYFDYESKINFIKNSESDCSICFHFENDEHNAIIYCEGCNVGFHKECYGLSKIPDGKMICDLCLFQEELIDYVVFNEIRVFNLDILNSEVNKINLKKGNKLQAIKFYCQDEIKCIFCLKNKGALKYLKNDNGSIWFHVICCLISNYTNVTSYKELKFIINDFEESMDNCVICKSNKGEKIENNGLFIHFLCAYFEGYNFNLKVCSENNNKKLAICLINQISKENSDIRNAIYHKPKYYSFNNSSCLYEIFINSNQGEYEYQQSRSSEELNNICLLCFSKIKEYDNTVECVKCKDKSHTVSHYLIILIQGMLA